MKKLIQAILVGMVIAAFSVTATAGVQSLRGDNALDKDAKMFPKHKQKKAKKFDRSFEQAPPMIPHTVEKDKITLRGNTCMKCHSKENHKKEKAPVIGDSHFIDRDGKKLEKPSARRWFCNQCHAPQVDAEPLVELNF